MWGNTTGWIISAFLAMSMGGLLYYVAAPPTRTTPSNSAKLAIANGAIVLPIAPDTVVSPGTKDCDAGDTYRRAIEDYQLTPSAYENFQPMKSHEKDLSAVGDILAGRDCRSGTLFRKDLAKVINYENTQPDLEALKNAGTICCTFGKLYTNDKYNPKLQPDKAVKLWEAAFVLGWHLFDERATWKELEVGHGLMQSAGSCLLDYYGSKGKDGKAPNNEKAAKIKEFLEAELPYSAKLLDAFQIIGNVDENYAGKYAGDIFKIALSPTADPMFRVEALKHIGHYRFNSLSRGDQMAARKVLKDMIEDDKLPPTVKAAANAAHDLTLEKHNMVGGGA